jgi:exopolyphosphatase/guanosine-5'-triphosphate,3'-diphosphate pyrophosphatase
MKVLEITTQRGKYPVLIGKKILPKLEEYITGYDKILVLSNEKIGGLYFNTIKRTLVSHNNIEYFELKDGEEYKNIESAMKLYDFMIDKGFTRKSLIISLGGGVICDLGGYVASTYMRGIDFIQVPTSLLAQVDASIGGKVAINHPKGKNMIGTFKQPKMVLIDIAFLATLSRDEFLSGMGEVIKNSFIKAGEEYYNFLMRSAFKILQQDKDTLIEMIYESCDIKRKIVEEDEEEKGVRALLNFGHTYAHALETLFKYKKISHGEAVAKGIIFVSEISKELGFVDEKFISKIEKIFNIYGIDYDPIHIEWNRLQELLKRDKKNEGSDVRFVLPKAGMLSIEKIPLDIVKKINDEIKNRLIKTVIDIGTNSCRVFVAVVERVGENFRIIQPLYKDLVITRLGEDVNRNGFLLERAIDRTVDALRSFSIVSKNYGTSENFVFATSATRDSSNREEFIKKAKEETGFTIYCIDGKMEAELSFLGTSSEFMERILMIDIGGGSTEFTLGIDGKIEYGRSFDVGAVRVTEKFFKDGNYSEENVEKCVDWIKNEIKDIKRFEEEKYEFVGVAGTVTTNVSVAEHMLTYDGDRVHLYPLSLENIEENLKLYLSKDLTEREKIVGLDPKRADVIIGGTLVLKTIMEILGKSVIIASEKDNLEGAMKLSFGR